MGIISNILFTLTICVWIGIGYMYQYYTFSQEDDGLCSAPVCQRMSLWLSIRNLEMFLG